MVLQEWVREGIVFDQCQRDGAYTGFMSDTNNPDSASTPAPEPENKARFNPEAEHQVRPVLRAIRAFPAQAGEQQVMGLADARQVSDRVVFTSPAFHQILGMMDGESSVGEIVAKVGGGLTDEILQDFVAQLDDAGLLEGPVFEGILKEMHKAFDSSDILPPGPSAAIADQIVAAKLGEDATDEKKAELGGEYLAKMFDEWIDEALKDAEDPSFEELPAAVIVPHIDYPRGWKNYASVWGRLRVVDRPDRVVILGTNHFGFSTGVCGCDKGYESPIGVSHADDELIGLLRGKLGDELFANRFDHEREHSVELQIPWVQHSLGADENGAYCKVFGALVHDPTVNQGQSYDGTGVDLDAFVTALREALDELGGTTLIVCSADLSHVGPAFGDETALAGEDEKVEAFRNKVIQHDQQMLELISKGSDEELITSMTWQQNPTRWCSIGNIVVGMRVTGAEQVRILSYVAAMDQQGLGMVSSAAAVVG